MPDPLVNTEEVEEPSREDALFGPEAGDISLPTEEAEDVSVAPEGEVEDEEMSDEEAEAEIDRAEELYEKAVSAYSAEPEAEAEAAAAPDSSAAALERLTEKAIDALSGQKRTVEEVEEENDMDWSKDPAVVSALRARHSDQDDDEFARTLGDYKIFTEHVAKLTRSNEISPLEKRVEAFENAQKQQAAMADLGRSFQGTLSTASEKSAIHAFVAQHYNRDMENSLLGRELAEIGRRDGPQSLLSVVRSPRALSRLIDGLAFDIESNYGNVSEAQESEGGVEQSTVATTRAPRRQQKRTKKPTEAEADAALREETFGAVPVYKTWGAMKPSKGRGF